MSLSKIKQEFNATIIAFGDSGAPLGERTDIDQLAIMAQESQNPTLLQLFDVLPPLEVLKKTKVSEELKKVPVVGDKK